MAADDEVRALVLPDENREGEARVDDLAPELGEVLLGEGLERSLKRYEVIERERVSGNAGNIYGLHADLVS